MCDGIDEPPTATHEERRRARKPHRCRECYKPILPGTLYWRASSLSDGSWSAWPQCEKCHRVEAAHAKAEHSMGGNSSYYVGQLLEQVKECISEEPHYVVAFRAAWKGEPVPKKPPEPDRRQRANFQ